MNDRETDAWILLSVSAGGSTLRDVIAAADWINHAIPTAQELRTSLGRLRVWGLVERRGERFALTSAGGEMIERVGATARTQMKVWDGVAAALAELEDLEHTPEEIADEDLRAAYREYTGG